MYVFLGAGIVVLALLIAGLFAIRYSASFQVIGYSAAASYVLYGSEVGLLAANTVHATMSNGDATKYMERLKAMPTHGIDQIAADKRKYKLVQTLAAADRTVRTSLALKDQLRSMHSEWLVAIQRCDMKRATKLLDDAMINHMQQNRQLFGWVEDADPV